MTIIYIIFFLLFVLMIIIIKKKDQTEGFIQSSSFISKREEDIYDNFYAQVYNIIYNPKSNADFITDIIIKDTLANTKTSVILIVGCETGILGNNLQLQGFDTYIIDQSKDMIDNAILNFPNLKTKIGNIKNPMIYDKYTFSHILCTGFTLYHIKDKLSFFRNVYQWLISNGYFILQLVDRDHFNTIIPAGRSHILDTPQKYTKERITETSINFGNFHYKSKYNFDKMKETDVCTMTENFTDIKTNKVRQNEHTLYMETIEYILELLRKCGFIVKGQFKLQSDNQQYIYIIERPN